MPPKQAVDKLANETPERSSEFRRLGAKIESDYINKYFFLNSSNEPQDKIDPEKEFQMLTSIRYDPKLQIENNPTSCYFLFPEHLHRLQLQLNFFKWDFELPRDLFLDKLNEVVRNTKNNNPEHIENETAYKLRVLVSRDGNVQIGATEAVPRTNLLDGLGIEVLYLYEPVISQPVSTEPLLYKIYIDTERLPISVFTSFKTTNRDHYNAARQRVLQNPSDYKAKQDVLLFNNMNQVVECTISNVAFKRMRKNHNNELVVSWVTPPISSGCLCGVVRQMLINKGLVFEQQVLISDVKKGEEILYFNGIIGVARGVIS